MWLESGGGGGARWRLVPPIYEVRCTKYDLESSHACARIRQGALAGMIYDAYRQ